MPAGMLAVLQHAQLAANRRGLIRDVPRLILTYAAARGITERAAWAALARATAAGWIRRTQGAAPGIPARYELQLPVDLVPPGLPEDLARELGLWDEALLPAHDNADARHGHLTATPPTPYLTLAPAEQGEAEGDVQTSPSSREGLSPLIQVTSPTPGAISDPAYPGSPDAAELTAARQVLVRCRSWWIHQRGLGGGLAAAAEAELAEAVAVALRRSTPSELVELMTVQSRSARSLPHLVGARLWRLIRERAEFDRRAVAELPVDDRRAEQAAAAAAAARGAVARRTASVRAAARDAIVAARGTARARRDAAVVRAPRLRETDTGWRIEAEMRAAVDAARTPADVRAIYARRAAAEV